MPKNIIIHAPANKSQNSKPIELFIILTFLSVFLTFGSLDFEKNLIGKKNKNHTQKIKLANKKKIDTKTVSSPWTKYKITAKTIKKIPVDKKGLFLNISIII